jgi:hypothetical protein
MYPSHLSVTRIHLSHASVLFFAANSSRSLVRLRVHPPAYVRLSVRLSCVCLYLSLATVSCISSSVFHVCVLRLFVRPSCLFLASPHLSVHGVIPPRSSIDVPGEYVIIGSYIEGPPIHEYHTWTSGDLFSVPVNASLE